MTEAAVTPPDKWDRHSIKAEIHRRGMSLSGIARDAGLAESACRLALMGMSRAGADAIAGALGIPFDTLFPADMFVRSRSSHAKPTARADRESRKIRNAPVDGAKAGA